jgi:hypothetical protein
VWLRLNDPKAPLLLMSKRLSLLTAVLVLAAIGAVAREPLTDAQVRQAIIQESIAA